MYVSIRPTPVKLKLTPPPPGSRGVSESNDPPATNPPSLSLRSCGIGSSSTRVAPGALPLPKGPLFYVPLILILLFLCIFLFLFPLLLLSLSLSLSFLSSGTRLIFDDQLHCLIPGGISNGYKMCGGKSGQSFRPTF